MKKMYLMACCFIVIIFFITSCSSQLPITEEKNDVEISTIDAEEDKRYVLNNIMSRSLTLMEISGESTEGGEAYGYYNDEKCVFIGATFFGETGKKTTYIYFGNVFTVVEEYESKYDMPISADHLNPMPIEIITRKFVIKDGSVFIFDNEGYHISDDNTVYEFVNDLKLRFST